MSQSVTWGEEMVKLSNNQGGDPVDGTSSILRVTPDGLPVGEGILGEFLHP